MVRRARGLVLGAGAIFDVWSIRLTDRKPYTPRPYQPLGVDFMLSVPRGNLWAGMGLGKSLMALTMLDTRYISGDLSRPTLILGPKRVAENVWSDEVEKWHHLRDLQVSPIVGDERARRKAMARDVQIYTTNYEQLPWLVHHYGDDWPFEMVIADEADRLKGFRLKQGGIRAQTLSKVAFKSKYWMNLTGTPSANGVKDLWGQCWFLDQGKRLGLTYTAFMSRWFSKGYDDVMKPMPHAMSEITARLKDITLSLDPKDWFDLKDPIVTVVPVKLPPKVMKTYKEFEKTMFTELACGAEVEVFNAATLTNKCMQIANGFLYHEGAVKALHEAKLEALDSIITEAHGPVLVAYQFVEDMQMILKKYPDAALLSKAEGMKRFKAGQAQIGLAHPASMGHGVDGLQHVCNVLVRYGHNWDLGQRMQMLERIGPVRQLQAGLERPVWVYDIVAEGTIDEAVLERHKSKRQVQDLLLEAMKRSGGVKL